LNTRRSRLLAQLDRLVDAGHTVTMVEHTMRVVAAGGRRQGEG